MIGRFFVPLLGLALAPFGAAAATPAARPVYLDPTQPLEARVDDLLGRLTLDEKISLLHGDSKFSTAPIPRLGIPRRWLSDGPHGVREEVRANSWDPARRTDDFSTYLPTEIGLAATWNPAMAQAFGTVIGQEARARGKDIMLGPGLNIQRTPLCGRNFEYLGEDPYLTGRMAVAYIEGEQAQGISSCAKHFACNNQEWERNSIDVDVGERALREIYLPAFQAAVQEAHVWAVMAAYNRLRGQFCAENSPLLNGILKGEWGFRGLVVSDWGAVHDTEGAAVGGLDLEMGTEHRAYADYFLAAPFKAAIEAGKYPRSLLDDKVRRNLRVMIATGVLDGKRPPGSINTEAHQKTARKVAEQAIVLLKNRDGLLPLDAEKVRSIAVIGDNAVRRLAYGGESSAIKAFYEITPLQGILDRIGRSATVTFSEGYGPKAAPGAVDRAVAAARAAEVAIVVGGLNHDPGFDCEGTDRVNLDLPYGQAELIRRVVAANPRTIVVLMAGSPVAMDPWLGEVPAVIDAWYPGMEGGHAIAEVLFGDVNPSGKLPCTFPKRLEDSPPSALGIYPGQDGVAHYTEGLLVGYRWYDTKQIEPLFPFGYGLSYTTFAYSDLKLTPAGPLSASAAAEKDPAPVLTVTFTLANTGTRAGAEVTELYVHEEHPALERPEKELKAFQKVFLVPGERRRVSLSLPWRAFAYYDPALHGWVTQPDQFKIEVGSSSRDIRLAGGVHL